jgi:antitoxin HigA-1
MSRSWIIIEKKEIAMVRNKMRPIHPGEILREEYLEPMGMSVNSLAKALNVTPARINDIVRERRGVSADTALRLARYFGTDARSWMNLQAAYDLRVAELAQEKRIFSTIRPRAA